MADEATSGSVSEQERAQYERWAAEVAVSTAPVIARSWIRACRRSNWASAGSDGLGCTIRRAAQAVHALCIHAKAVHIGTYGGCRLQRSLRRGPQQTQEPRRRRRGPRCR